MIYLASPFASGDAVVRASRLRQSAKLTARLAHLGHFIFCPLTFGNGLTEASSQVAGWTHEQWLEFDLQFLGNARELYVALFEGWHESKGVQQEIAYARAHKIPIYYLNPVTLDLFDYPPRQIKGPLCETCHAFKASIRKAADDPTPGPKWLCDDCAPKPESSEDKHYCTECENEGWISFGLGAGDPHFRECSTCGNPDNRPCP